MKREEKIVKCVHCTKDKYESQLTHSKLHGGLVCNNCDADNGKKPTRDERMAIPSPQKRIDELETALRVILDWAKFDIKNKPTIPRSLVPVDVVRLCQEALNGSVATKMARDTW